MVEEQTDEEIVDTTVEEVVEETDNDSDIVKVDVQDTDNQISVLINEESKKETFTKEAYVEILEMLRTPTFGQLMTTLGPKDAVIVSLRLGYVDGKCFSTESVSNFLGVSQEEVIERTKKVLTVYRDSFNDFIDKAIEATCEKSIQYVKKED